MKKTLISLVLILILVLTSGISLSAEGLTTKTEKTQITNLLNRYFNMRDEDFSQLSARTTVADTISFSEEMRECVSLRRFNAQESIINSPLQIGDTDNYYFINSIVKKNGLTVVEAYELVKQIYVYYEDGIFKTKDSGWGVWHEMGLSQNNGVWTIEYDYYDELATGTKTGEAVIENPNFDKKSELLQRAFGEVGLLPSPAPTRTLSFSVTNVINYARTYALNYNPNFSSFSGDCANFASQALDAGGLSRTSTWQPYTTAWISSTNLRNYLKSLSGFYYINNPSTSDIRMGDILFYDWSPSGCSCTCAQCSTYKNCEGHTSGSCTGRTYNHTAVCTSYAGSVPLVSCHTNDFFDHEWTLGGFYMASVVQTPR